ncbi:MAG: hypothetical protein J6Q22_16820 [Prevotella sp.]|nr:hypothetical protein [Prevotella sp.]
MSTPEIITALALIIIFLLRIVWGQHRAKVWKRKYEPAFTEYRTAWITYTEACYRKAKTLEEELDCDPAELTYLREDFLRKQSVWLSLWQNQ